MLFELVKKCAHKLMQKNYVKNLYLKAVILFVEKYSITKWQITFKSPVK